MREATGARELTRAALLPAAHGIRVKLDLGRADGYGRRVMAVLRYLGS